MISIPFFSQKNAMRHAPWQQRFVAAFAGKVYKA
jgi:hypothetical protein